MNHMEVPETSKVQSPLAPWLRLSVPGQTLSEILEIMESECGHLGWLQRSW